MMQLLPKASSLKSLTILTAVLLVVLFTQYAAHAQTAGLIFKPATNGGNKVLDPNGDGYVSSSTAGFTSTTDEGSTSEIPYRPIPALINEPLGDLTTGSAGGHTDLAPPQYQGANGSPIAAYFDGNNLLFRVRLGGQSTASKGYSIMIDTDNQFGNLIAGNNPTTTPNPGFEFEVVLAANFDVSVYNHTGLASGSTVKAWSGSVNQYSQKSIAASTGGGNPDYFYDFYVPLSALPGVTASTQLRMSGLTITSAQSSISGTVSDLGGVNFAAYGYSKQLAWADLFKTAQPTSLTQIQASGFIQKTATPIIFDAFSANSTTITGSSLEAAGTDIMVYRNNTVIATGKVLANGTWTATLSAGVTLAQNNELTAKATASGKLESDTSKPVKVTYVQTACATAAPVLSQPSKGSNKGLDVSFTNPTQASITVTLNVYEDVSNTSQGTTTVTIAAGGNYLWEWQSQKSGQSILGGSYYATAAIVVGSVTGCQSLPSNRICVTTGTGNKPVYSQTQAPVITTPIANINTSIVQGTGTVGAVVALYKNQTVLIGSLTIPANGNWSFTIPAGSLTIGDTFNARITSGCSSGPSNTLTVVPITNTAPTIVGTFCGPITTLSGTSSELAGTTIKLYTGTSTTALAQTGTVNASGTWTITGLNIAPGVSVTAKAMAVGKSESVASNSVTSSAQTSNAGLTITGPVAEYTNSVSGTTSAPVGSTIKLYIAGSYTGNSIVTTGTNWTITGVSYFETFAGASVHATVTSGNNSCESAPSPSVFIECKPTNTSFLPTTAATPICYGTPAVVNLSSSEAGTVYNLYLNGVATGTSVLGTGGAIKLSTGPLFATTSQIQVKALRVGADCPAIIGSNLTVNVYDEVPNNFTLTATTTSSACPNVSTDITLANAVTGYTYQLFRVVGTNTKALIGSPVTPSVAGNIVFPNIVVPSTSTYSVLITRNSTVCAADNLNARSVVVTITGGANVNGAVTISQNKVCVGQSCTIGVATQTGYTYRILLTGSNTQIGSVISGDGTVKSVNTGALSQVGTNKYAVEVTSVDGTCPATNMSTQVSVEVTDGTKTVVSAGPNQTICGNTAVTLAGSDTAPGTGLWTLVNKPAGAANPVFSDANNRFATVSGLVTGSYTFEWAVSTCSSTKTSEVTITINCPAAFSVGSSLFFNQYNNGDVIASASDVDGGVKSASLVAGTLPAGTELNLLTGSITVTDKNALQGGNYYVTVRTIDAFGISTDTPLAIQFYDQAVAPVSLNTYPVELVYFTATVTKANVTLQWLTASEKDNDKFIIERSYNGKEFSTIGTLKGAGNSSVGTKYSFQDNAPVNGTIYYRLKQVDFDGKHTYSKVLAVSTTGVVVGMQLQAYPNPFARSITASVTAPKMDTATLQLIDLKGRAVLTKAVSLAEGINQLELVTESLPQGMYILTITGNGIDQKVKVLKGQ